jgi:hypothetical protein
MNGQDESKSGCFLRGCLIVLAGSLAVAIFGALALFYLYDNVLGQFSTAQPPNLSAPAPSHEEYQEARRKLENFRWAVTGNRDETIEFTAADLNALAARHPDFAGARGRVRFAIADSALTLDLNVPADGVALPRLKGRWFQISLHSTFEYQYDQFKFSPSSIALGRWRLPGWLLTSSFGSSFSQSFSKSYQQSLRKDARSTAFWKHIKRIMLDGDKVVVTTQRMD